MNIKRNVFNKVVIPSGVIAGISVAGIGIYSINHSLSTSAQDLGIEEQNIAINYGDTMQINPAYEEYLRDVEAGNGSNWKLVPEKYINNTLVDGVESNASLDHYVSASNLPASYSLIENGFGTTIKNQGSEGDCWAYTISSVLESYLLKNKNVNTELSAKQLDYLLAKGSTYSNFLKGVGFNERELGDGSNFFALTYVLGGDYTPVSDASFFAKMKANDSSLANYSSYRQFQDLNDIRRGLFGQTVGAYTTPMPASQVYDKQAVNYIPTDFKSYSITNANNSAVVGEIKNNVMTHGAAFVGTFGPGTNNCWDAASKTVIDRGVGVCGGNNGHAMTIVGWDDNHTYVDPATGTTKAGAFLLQNSWGSKESYAADGITLDSIWANYGPSILAAGNNEAAAKQTITNYLNSLSDYTYLWLAYDVASSESITLASILNVSDNTWDNIYDAADIAASLNGNANENVVRYTAGENETLTAVGIQTIAGMDQYDITYKVSVDTTGTGSHWDPLGKVTLPAGVTGQTMVNLSQSVNVSGNFLLKITVTVEENGSSYDLNLMSQGSDLRNYVIPVAYTINGNFGQNDPGQPGNPGEGQDQPTGEVDGEGERNPGSQDSTPDPLPDPTPAPTPEPQVTVPDTGAMTAEDKSVIVSSALVGIVSAIIIARIAYVVSRTHTVKLRK